MATPAITAAILATGPFLLLIRQTVGGRTILPFDILATDPVFAPALSDRVAAVPWNALAADLIYQNLPWKTFFLSALRDGQAPLWNPHLFGGMPFFGVGLHSMLFPSNLLFLILEPAQAFGWVALVNLWIAAGAAYILARALKLNRPAALVAGIAWSVSLQLVTNTALPMIQAGLAVTPIPLAGILCGIRPDEPDGLLPSARSTLWLVLTAIEIMLVAFAGHVELLVQVLFITAILLSALVWHIARTAGRLRAFRALVWGALRSALGLRYLPFSSFPSTSWPAPTFELEMQRIKRSSAGRMESVSSHRSSSPTSLETHHIMASSISSAGGASRCLHTPCGAIPGALRTTSKPLCTSGSSPYCLRW